jgi:hypothetical protein
MLGSQAKISREEEKAGDRAIINCKFADFDKALQYSRDRCKIAKIAKIHHPLQASTPTGREALPKPANLQIVVREICKR